MRKAFLFIAIMFSAAISALSADYFLEDDWEKALQESKKSGKLIFLDAYTDWCGWCKVMDEKTFSKDEIREKLTENFIPLKLNMEEGAGLKLATKYQIFSYPSYVIFDSDGRLLYITSGYEPPEKFITTLDECLDEKNHKPSPGISTQLDPGFPEFYKKSFLRGDAREMPEKEDVHAYLKKRDDIFDEVSWALIKRFCDSDCEYSEFALRKLDKYEEKFGERETQKYVVSLYNNIAYRASREKSKEMCGKSIAIAKSYYKKYEPYYDEMIWLFYYKQSMDTLGYFKTAPVFMEKYNYKNLNYVNELAWNFYLMDAPAEYMLQAENWMNKVIDKEPDNFAFLDTYAAVLYKNGKYDEALKYADIAIEKGKAGKENVEGTEKLKENILEAKGK